MMKATLEFDLWEPDEREAHFRCVKALDMALALNEIKSYICNRYNESNDEDTINIKDVYEKIIGELDRRGVYPDELVS